MMRFKEAFVIREDYGATTGYGVEFADSASGQSLRLGVNFPRRSNLLEVATSLRELAKKCEDMSLSEQIVGALESGGQQSEEQD